MTRSGDIDVIRVVTLASSSGKYGGPTDTAIRQAELLTDDGFSVRVVAGSFKYDERKHPLLDTARVRRLLPENGYTTATSTGLAVKLYRAIERSKVVHVSIARELVPVLAVAIALQKRRTVVVQPHGMLTARTSYLHRAVDIVLKPLVRRADSVIALTDRERRELMDWLGGSSPPITVVGNPSPTLEKRQPAHPPTVLFAARLHERKRVADFLEAAQIAYERGVVAAWHVAGPDQGDLPLVIAAEKRNPRLRYLGALSEEDLSAELARCSVFVLPSRSEPWGNVLATAIKANIPVVLTESSALRDEVELLRAGEIVPDSSPSEIANAVEKLLSSSPLPVNASKNAARTKAVETRFGNTGIATKLLDLFTIAPNQK